MISDWKFNSHSAVFIGLAYSYASWKKSSSSTSFNRVCSVCGNRATFLFPIRHILIPVEFLSNSFFAFGVGILPLSFLAASMISFSLFPFASTSWIFPSDLLALHIQPYSRSTQPRFQQLDRYSLYLRSSVVALAIGACMRRIEMVCVIRSLKWRFCPQLSLIFDFLPPIALFHHPPASLGENLKSICRDYYCNPRRTNL